MHVLDLQVSKTVAIVQGRVVAAKPVGRRLAAIFTVHFIFET